MKVAIINYNAGNTQSVVFALERLGIEPVLTADAFEIGVAEKIIFPGVGAAGAAMEHLKENNLIQLIPQLRQPVLGICLGMQLFCQYSEENQTNCLDIIPVNVELMLARIVPHTGWNQLSETQGPLFTDVTAEESLYFVHSYAVPVCDFTTAVTTHEIPFSASVQYKNFYGVQFHPEKSGDVGAKILENFLALT